MVNHSDSEHVGSADGSLAMLFNGPAGLRSMVSMNVKLSVQI